MLSTYVLCPGPRDAVVFPPDFVDYAWDVWVMLSTSNKRSQGIMDGRDVSLPSDRESETSRRGVRMQKRGWALESRRRGRIIRHMI